MFLGGQTVSGAFSFKFGDEAQSQYGAKKLAELRENISELKLNVNTFDDLVNGSTGTIIAFEYNKKNEVECIIVRFDKDSMGQQQRAKYPNLAAKYKNENGTPVFRQEMETMGRTRKGHKLGTGSTAKVYQFPLIVNYASTNHKIQVIKKFS